MLTVLILQFGKCIGNLSELFSEIIKSVDVMFQRFRVLMLNRINLTKILLINQAVRCHQNNSKKVILGIDLPPSVTTTNICTVYSE